MIREMIQQWLFPDSEYDCGDECGDETEEEGVTVDMILRDEIEVRVRGALSNATVEPQGEQFVAKTCEAPKLSATGMSRGKAMAALTVMLAEYYQ